MYSFSFKEKDTQRREGETVRDARSAIRPQAVPTAAATTRTATGNTPHESTPTVKKNVKRKKWTRASGFNLTWDKG